jgi:hypothetical protein
MPARPRPLAALLSVALAVAARAPAAQPRPPETVRLEVTRDARSARCPDASAVRALLRDRLRREAVRDDAATSASLRFTRERARYAATLRLRRPGLPATVRQLRSAGDDCARLADAAALVLALAIDPIGALPPVAPPAPAVVQSTAADVQSAAADVHGPPADVHGPSADVHGPPADVQTPPADVQTPPADVQTPPAPVQRPASLQLAALAALSTGVAPASSAHSARASRCA